MFFQLIIAMFLGFTSPSTTISTVQDNTETTLSDGVDPITGGDVRQNPPPK